LILGVLLGGMLAVDAQARGAPANNNLIIETDERQSTYFPVTLSSPYHYTYRVVNSFPHDPEAFTQGLVFENGTLFEGTGLYRQSTLRKVELETGVVLQSLSLASQYFGEGITLYKDQVIQLTWRSNKGFIYDKDSFELLQTFSYPTEGWGITHDGVRLIVSDGTPTLYFWDPVTFEEIGRIEVHDQDGPVTRLNELEYVRGEVFANVYYTDRIARINPHTGRVTGWINLKGLLDSEEGEGSGGVLNGIAYDAENDRLFVTGKRWPTLLEIRLIAWEE
jgi:glutamine cyclotransferase